MRVHPSVTVDVYELERAVEEEDWATALAVARGVFLEGSDRPVSPEHERWIAKLTQRQEELASARVRAERAEAAYRDWRQRNYPRGAAKEAMLTELEEAREALRIAERRLPKDLEAARRDGVPPGTLRRFR